LIFAAVTPDGLGVEVGGAVLEPDFRPRVRNRTTTTITTARTMSNNVRLVKPIALLGAMHRVRVFVG
jgi:hypothetical protein